MGRCKYETHVRPHLSEIPEMYKEMTEAQIAKKLKVSKNSFSYYKTVYPELREALEGGKEVLCEELKSTLKKKARGFYYEETKTVKIHNPDEDAEQEWIERIEINKKYAQPDTGAAHLLLKNYDPNWRNDDLRTMQMKEKAVELQEKKIEASEW